MGATTRNSALYNKLHVNKYLGDAADRGGLLFPIPFAHTVVSGETGGASAGTQDKVNLCVISAYYQVIALFLVADNIWASAGANGTLQIGDSGDDDRYMIATELYTATGGPITADGKSYGAGVLALAGMNYKPTVETVVQAIWKTANPVVGKKFSGCFLTIKPA